VGGEQREVIKSDRRNGIRTQGVGSFLSKDLEKARLDERKERENEAARNQRGVHKKKGKHALRLKAVQPHEERKIESGMGND